MSYNATKASDLLSWLQATRSQVTVLAEARLIQIPFQFIEPIIYKGFQSRRTVRNITH